MIALLLSFLALASSQELPKISFLIVSASLTNEDIEEIEDWKDYKDDLIDECEKYIRSDQKDQCESYIDSISSIILSNGIDINEKLAEVSKETEYLFYMVHTRHINVNLNNLPSKMTVYMHPINLSRTNSTIDDIGQLVTRITTKLIESEYDGTIESDIRYSQLINKSHKHPEVLMEGSISDKVSFLILSHIKVVYFNEFKCENVYLSSGVLVSKNAQAIVNNFIIDTETFTYYSILHSLVTDQFTLVDFNRDNNSVPEYQIAYYDDFWGIQCSFDGNFTHGRYHWKVPYYVTKKLAIICYSNHFIIEAINKNLTDYPDLNLTVTEDGLIESEPTTLSSVDKISIESNGFDTINKNIWPSIFVTYDKEKFSIDTSKSDLDIDGEQIYTYKPKPHHSKVGIIVGSVVAVVVVIAIISVVVIVVLKKKNSNKTNEIYEKNLLNEQNQPNNYHDPVPNTPNL